MRRRKPNRWAKSWFRRYQPSSLIDLEITSEEIMADLDPGWALFRPRVPVRSDGQDSERPGRAA